MVELFITTAAKISKPTYLNNHLQLNPDVKRIMGRKQI
jgi:hypothetical protein